ncbi:MAG: hypothetical protein M1831_002267 [Alyxoria varia]|nr:MAG: hypothetical protein M1831_002267 [Alyxoria varia]
MPIKNRPKNTGWLSLHVGGEWVLNQSDRESGRAFKQVIPKHSESTECCDDESEADDPAQPPQTDIRKIEILWSNRWVVVVLCNGHTLYLYGIQYSHVVQNKMLRINDDHLGPICETQHDMAQRRDIVSAFGDHNGLLGILDSDSVIYLFDDKSFVLRRLHFESREQNKPDHLGKHGPSEAGSRSSTRFLFIAINGAGRVAAIPKPGRGSDHISILEFSSFDHFLSYHGASSSSVSYSSPSPAPALSESHDDPSPPIAHHTLSYPFNEPESLVSTATAFALLTKAGNVFTWGDARYPNMLGREVSAESPAARPAVVQTLADDNNNKVTKITTSAWLVGVVTTAGSAWVWGLGTSTTGKQDPWEEEAEEAPEPAFTRNVMTAMKKDNEHTPESSPTTGKFAHYDTPYGNSARPTLIKLAFTGYAATDVTVADLALGENSAMLVLAARLSDTSLRRQGYWHSELWGIGDNSRGQLGRHTTVGDGVVRPLKYLRNWRPIVRRGRRFDDVSLVEPVVDASDSRNDYSIIAATLGRKTHT